MRNKVDEARAIALRALKRGGELTTIQLKELTGCSAKVVIGAMDSTEFQVVSRSDKFTTWKLRTENADEQDNSGTGGAATENPTERKQDHPAVKRDFRFGKASYRDAAET